MNDDSLRGETKDELLNCLASTPRRQVLDELRSVEPDERLEQDRLAAAVDAESAARLHHVHLPKLDDAGLVEWYPDANAVYRGPGFDDAALLLDTLERLDGS